MWRINHIIAHSHLRRSLFLRTKYQLCASDRRKHLLFNLFYRATDCLCGNLTEFFFVVIPLNLQHIIAVIISLQINAILCYLLQSNIYLHSEYNPNFYYNDLAILRLYSALVWTYYVKPILLPSVSATFADNMACIVSGFGKTFYGIIAFNFTSLSDRNEYAKFFPACTGYIIRVVIK